jgi:hypothetical protein
MRDDDEAMRLRARAAELRRDAEVLRDEVLRQVLCGMAEEHERKADALYRKPSKKRIG